MSFDFKKMLQENIRESRDVQEEISIKDSFQKTSVDSVHVNTVSVTRGFDWDDDNEYPNALSVYVEHDGPYEIYTDTGFEKAISQMIGQEVSFSEQGMQDDQDDPDDRIQQEWQQGRCQPGEDQASCGQPPERGHASSITIEVLQRCWQARRETATDCGHD